MEVYKESKDFMNDATEISADAYMIGFTDCKDKVVQVHLELDLGSIVVDDTGLEEGKEEKKEL